MIARVSIHLTWRCYCGWESPDGRNADRPATIEVTNHRNNCHAPRGKDPTDQRWQYRTVVHIG